MILQPRQDQPGKPSNRCKAVFSLWLSLVILAGCISPPTAAPTPKTAGEFARANYTATPFPLPTQPTQTLTPTGVFSVPAGTPIPSGLAAITSVNAPELKELAHWGSGILQDFAWSPDGSLLAVAATRTIRLYQRVQEDANGESLTQRLVIEAGGILRSLALSPDGVSLAAGEDGGWVSVYRTADGSLMKRWRAAPFAVLSLAYSPDGVLAAGSWDGALRLWNAAGELQAEYLSPDAGRVEKIIFAGAGKELLTWSRRQPLNIWNLEKGVLAKSYVVNRSSCPESASAAFSPGGEIIATSCGAEARVFRLSDGYTLGVFGGFASEIRSLAVSSAGGFLAVAAGNTISLYRLEDGALLQQISFTNGETGAVGLAFSPDDSTLGILGDGLSLWTFSAISLAAEARLAFRVDRMAVSPGASWIAAWRDGSTQVRLVEVGAQKAARTVRDAQTQVMQTAFSPDGNLMGIAADVLRIYDLQSLDRLADLSAPQEGAIYRFRVFNEETGQTTIETLQNQAPLASAAFAPDGSLVAAGGYNRSIYLWDLPGADPRQAVLKAVLASGEPAVLVDGDPERDWIRQLAFSGDGRLLAAVWGEQVDIWETGSGSLIRSILLAGEGEGNGLSPRLCHLSFARSDGALLAAWDDRSRLFDLGSGNLLEESPALCGMPWTDGASLTDLALPGASLHIFQPEKYPNPGSLVYLPAENLLAVEQRGGGESWVQFWQVDPAAASGRILASSPASFTPGYALAAALLPEAQKLAQVWGDGSVLLSAVPSGLEERLSPAPGETYDLASLNAVGSLAVFSTPDQKLLLHDLSAGLADAGMQELGRGKVKGLAFSADGSLLAAALETLALESLSVQVWHTTDRTLLQTLDLPAPLSDSRALLFSPDGSWLAARTPEGISLWGRNSSTGEFSSSAVPFSGNCLAFSADGSLAAVCATRRGEQQVSVYRLSHAAGGELAEVRLVKTIPSSGGSLAFSPDSSLLAVLNLDLSLWSLQDGSLLAQIPSALPYASLFFFPDGNLLAAVSGDGRILIYGVP